MTTRASTTLSALCVVCCCCCCFFVVFFFFILSSFATQKWANEHRLGKKLRRKNLHKCRSNNFNGLEPFFRSCRKVKPLMNTEIMHIFFLLLYSSFLVSLFSILSFPAMRAVIVCVCVFVCANVHLWLWLSECERELKCEREWKRKSVLRIKRWMENLVQTKNQNDRFNYGQKTRQKQVALNLYTKLLLTNLVDCTAKLW